LPTAGGHMEPNRRASKRCATWQSRMSPPAANPSYLTSQKPGDGHGARVLSSIIPTLNGHDRIAEIVDFKASKSLSISGKNANNGPESAKY